MRESRRLRLTDVRDVYRLIGECTELWDDAPAWRHHFLAGVNHLVRGRVGHYVFTPVDPVTESAGQPFAACGWDSDEQYAFFVDSLRRPLAEIVPGIAEVLTPLSRGRQVVASLHDIVAPDLWHRSEGYLRYHKPVGVDGLIASVRPRDGGIEFLGSSRAFGERRFTDRELAVLRLAHNEITPLVGTRLATEDQLGRHVLSPRLRETLEGLLAGLSEKQIAERAHRSPATIHRHVTTLYRRFHVAGRGELLTYSLPRRPR